jgi:capsid assembly protease
MSRDLVHAATRLFDRPLLIEPGKAEVILWVLRDRLGATLNVPAPAAFDPAAEPTEVEASRFIGSHKRAGRDFGLTRAADGVAMISVVGSLVNRGAWIGTSSGLCSYEGLSAQFRDVANDPEVHSVVIDIDSPGGEATGMFGLASIIREVRKTKHVVAVVNDVACSAAYGIASAADEIVVSPTSLVGSIGVVLVHLDRSAELSAKGIKPTLIYAGAHKVDGNPFGPLPDAVRADLQREVETFRERFVEAVEAGRGSRLTADAIRKTEARTYIGAEAVTVGLADRVATLDEVLFTLSTAAPPRSGAGNSSRGHMTILKPGASASEAAAPMTAEDLAAAVSAATTKALAEDRARGAAIQAAGEGFPKLSAYLVAAGVSADLATGIFGALAPDVSAKVDAAVAGARPAADPNGLAARVAEPGGPDLGPSAAAQPTSEEQIDAMWARTVARANGK